MEEDRTRGSATEVAPKCHPCRNVASWRSNGDQQTEQNSLTV